MRDGFKRTNLSASDVLALNTDVERVIALGKWSPKVVKTFVMNILPIFKSAYLNHSVDGIGRPVVRMHAEAWKLITKSTDYARVRDALGWFISTDDRPLATVWTLLPVLAADSPRSLGSSWDIMVMNARKSLQRAEGKRR